MADRAAARLAAAQGTRRDCHRENLSIRNFANAGQTEIQSLPSPSTSDSRSDRFLSRVSPMAVT